MPKSTEIIKAHVLRSLDELHGMLHDEKQFENMVRQLCEGKKLTTRARIEPGLSDGCLLELSLSTQIEYDNLSAEVVVPLDEFVSRADQGDIALESKPQLSVGC